jgi:hypothetical protein
MAAYNNYAFAGTGDSGVFISTDYGSSWFKSSLNNEYIRAMTLYGGNIFAGLHHHYSYNTWGMFQSSNYGNTWFQINVGFIGNPDLYSLLIANDYIFAGPSLNFVWRRPLSELVGINKVNSSHPERFSLSQNYPNPFNPVTKIKFAVPAPSPLERAGVRLVIYDALGREVQTLVNELLKPGTYEVDFDGSNFSSGVYYYTLSAGDYIETKKMAMIK